MAFETPLRSIVKSISWRIVATLTTVSIVYLFSGDATFALSVGGVEIIAKLLIFFLHDRAWNLSSWGIKKAESGD